MIDFGNLASNQLIGLALIVAGAGWMAWQKFGGQATAWWQARVSGASSGTPSAEEARRAIDTAITFAVAHENVRMEECLRSAGAATYTVPARPREHDHAADDGASS